MNFDINVTTWDETKECPISNLGNTRRKFCTYVIEKGHISPEIMLARHLKYETSKDFIKALFGKQLTCQTYSYRTWIWSLTNTDKSATLYIFYCKRGMSVSYHLDSNIDSVIDLYKDMITEMNKHLNITI